MKKIVFSIILLLASISASYAVPAYNQPITVKQPDGTELTIRLHGDEFLHWATCGNSLVAQGVDGYWHYATFNADGVSNAQGARVQSNQSGDGSTIVPPASAIEKAMQERQSTMKRTGSAPFSQKTAPSISNGEKRFLILLIEFSDKDFTVGEEDFAKLLSGENYTYNGATGSVNKYYKDVSFGKFDPQFDIYGPIRVSKTSAECAKDDCAAVIEACKAINETVNFKQYCNIDPNLVDNVFFFFPGYNQAEGGGENTIWPHAVTYTNPFLTLDGVGIYHYGCTSEFKGNSGETMAGIGTFCHEFGHVIGLPDFYDVDYQKNGEGNALEKLSLMSSGSYNNNGNTPPYFTYEEKHILGWNEGLTLLSDGDNTLQKTSTNKSYYNPSPTDGEYFIYESRPAEGWDKYTMCPGLAIYHIDKSDYVMPDGRTAAELWESGDMINAFASHQCMDLVESVSPESKLTYYSQDTFPGYNNVTSFTSNTTPGARSWAGVPTGYNISNISFNSTNGETSFTVTKERKIVGTVTNTAHQPFSGVEVVIKYVSSVSDQSSLVESDGNGLYSRSLSPAPNAAEYRVSTDSKGNFEVEIPKEGIYSVSVSKEGYSSFFSEVTVTDGITGVNVILSTPIEGGTTILKKYNSISSSSVGYREGTDCYAGLQYTPTELSDYVGYSINSISFIASNGGNGTADKVGVKVYFGNKLKCDCECTNPVFNTICTVDISSYGLKIPSNQAVTFVYYIINPSYDYSIRLADLGTPVDGANLINNSDNLNWSTYEGNVVLSASIINDSQVVNLSGISYIPHKKAYTAGETFDLKLYESSVNHPTSVIWKVNGEEASGSIKLTKGICTVRAYVTYKSGRKEIIETTLNVE